MYALCILLAVTATVPKGGKLYIKGSTVTMTATADGKGTKTPVPEGTEVVWVGPSADNKSMHEIEWKGKKGFVPMSSLTPNKAQEEISTPAPEPKPPAAGDPDELAALDTLKRLSASTAEQRLKVAAHVKTAGLQEVK